MQIGFASRKLQRCAESQREAIRAWGPETGQRYYERIRVLLAAPTFRLLFEVRSLHLHPLTGDRKRQYALTLVGRWRLIVEPVSQDKLLVLEVSPHYGN